MSSLKITSVTRMTEMNDSFVQFLVETWYGPLVLMAVFVKIGELIGKHYPSSTLTSLAEVLGRAIAVLLFPFLRLFGPTLSYFLFLLLLFAPYVYCFVLRTDSPKVYKVLTLLLMGVLGIIMGHAYGRKKSAERL